MISLNRKNELRGKMGLALSLRSSGTCVKASSSQVEMGMRAWARSPARDSGATTCRIGGSEGLDDMEFDKSQHCHKEKEKREVGEVPVLACLSSLPIGKPCSSCHVLQRRADEKQRNEQLLRRRSQRVS